MDRLILTLLIAGLSYTEAEAIADCILEHLKEADAETRRNDSGECQPPEVLSDPPSTLSESAGATWRGSDEAMRNMIAREIWRYQECPWDFDAPDGMMAELQKKLAVDEAEGIRKIICASELFKAYFAHRATPVQAEPVAWDDVSEDDPAVVCAAHAIAEHGIGRPWDDFLPRNSYDVDHGDLIEYGRAAVAALRANGYASPPTPVSGEADWKAIAKELSDTLLSLRPLGGSELLTRHGKGDSETYLADAKHFRLVIANTRNELHELKCDAVRQSRSASATPVSAGLDDMGKQRPQIESSKTTDGPNAKAGIE